MLQFIKKFISISFVIDKGHKSFDAITSGLQRMEDELRSLAAHHGLKTVEKSETIRVLHEEIDAHIADAAKASAAATKIGSLLG